MPPFMNAGNNKTPDLKKNEISDEAIELLYEIVRRAQSAPDRSSRALFNAYEEVLTEQELGPEDDSVLYRFLFHMQRDRRQNEQLVQRFQRVLDELGIEVEINEEGEGIEVTTELDNATKGQQAAEEHFERRGSFDSLLDGSADKIAGTAEAGQDLPLRSRRRSSGATRGGEANQWKKRRSQSDTEAQLSLPIRARMTSRGDRRVASEQQRPHRRRTASVSSHGSLQIWRHGRTRTAQFAGYEADDSEHTEQTTDLDLSNIQIPGVNAPIPDKRRDPHQPYVLEPYHPSDTRLMDDAAVFEQQRLHSLARWCMQQWRQRMEQYRQRDEDMTHRAVAMYDRVILRLSWGALVEEAHRRRSDRETTRFFGRLEKRAQRARDLLLLTKAFTHWANSAHDEVQRTSVARRHILRTKFFNGWREITAVNELKVQHFALAKFLDKWRRRTAEVRAKQNLALQLYDNNLLRKYYKDWFFKFCDIAAPAWHNVRLKRITFEKWLEIATIMRDRESWATDRRDRQLLRKSLQTWKQALAAVQAFGPQAEDARRRALLTLSLSTLQKEAQFAPLLAQFRSRVNIRIVRRSLQTWHDTTQVSRHAKYIDRMRVLHNAWTAWNDRLRVKALEDRINDRVLVETMYKWTLASRVSLFQRVHDRNLKETTFLTWITKTNEQRNTLDGAERRFNQFKRNQLLRVNLRKLEIVTAERRAEEFAVTSEYERKLKQCMFENLLNKYEHLQKLDRWAGDAQFYVLATRMIKTWNEATQHARRNRRREAYAHVRRVVKTTLVKKMFGIWREKVNAISDKERQANEMLRSRILNHAPVLFNGWHDRTIALLNVQTQALQQYHNRLKYQHLQLWSKRTFTVQAMDAQAVALRQESTELAAVSRLKKLGWKLWNIQRQEENAAALYQRNFEKHLRAMIRFWYEQAAEGMRGRPTSPTPTSRPRGGSRPRGHGEDGGVVEDEDGNDDGAGADVTGFLDVGGEETRRLEGWTGFDESALGVTNLDLSLSVSPQPQSARPSLSSVHPLQTRPQTFPQSQTTFQAPPPIPEDLAFDDPATFWASTPLHPPPTAAKRIVPGYLKTPSKRSVARSKRPELPASPEKTARGLDRGRGVMSAPPAAIGRDVGTNLGDLTSFERRLREGGVMGTASRLRGGRGSSRGQKGRARVEFGDVSHFG